MEVGNMIGRLDDKLSAEGNSNDCWMHEKSSGTDHQQA
jgi:hypothetical protein